MPVSWPFDNDIRLAGVGTHRISAEDARRQETTARAILGDLSHQPGLILADEVGMGKTYVALAVIASVLRAERNSRRPVVVMVPPALMKKWPREWEQFTSLCFERPDAVSWVRHQVVGAPTDFFRLLEAPKARRPHLLWMSTSCFRMGLSDRWIKLALVRLARTRTKMAEDIRKRLYKWASTLVRSRTLIPETVERLLGSDLTSWHRLLIQEGFLAEDAADPIPENLLRHQDELDLSPLIGVLRGEAIPGRKGAVSDRRLMEARSEFNGACQNVYRQWLTKTHWRAPLFVLDEAHHAKNDSTRLAGWMRSEEIDPLVTDGEGNERPLLWDKFDRMLFLTATPFQLGHHELIRVLRSFAAANWSDRNRAAPDGTREAFFEAICELEHRLDNNRLAGRRLDRLWGRLGPTNLAAGETTDELNAVNMPWWRRASTDGLDPLEREIVGAITACRQTKQRAERDEGRPWNSIRTWVIRHNRAATLPASASGTAIARRLHRPGVAILVDEGTPAPSDRGLPIAGDSAVPFLLAARAQGELAAGTAKTRAFFAEGLCSSYEAFHHTRAQHGDARDIDDEGLEVTSPEASEPDEALLVPLQWYERHIAELVPDKQASDDERGAHPKLRAVVDRVTKLWLTGEKVLVFCFYRQTARALRSHIGDAIEQATLRAVGEKLGIDAQKRPSEIRDRLSRIVRRLGDDKSPFHAEVLRVLGEPFEHEEFRVLRERAKELMELLAAYVRSPTFIARYLPLELPEVQEALGQAESRPRVVRAGVEALGRALAERADSSAFTLKDRVFEFLRFAKELAERRVVTPDDGTAAINPLDEYIDALGVYLSHRSHQKDDDDEARSTGGHGTYRVLPTVRMVFGATNPAVRERLMLAFNSPLFPEILISSAVLAEGVDLHRFCRYVIHHDLCWNPSTLEQRTGRVDRIRCKAEVTRRSIVIHEPYIAGSADEKMYRVVRDRERWFQIVMGQKFELDESSSEKLAQRVPLPPELAATLIFDLRRAEAETEDVGTLEPANPISPISEDPVQPIGTQEQAGGMGVT
jgi:hypothetical protein